ncbi:MAG: family 1 encapsulin nanocompartment shell protein [Aquificaceae bacterium]|nr:family 1 encapsulin nanocompartment shell protein [Aquificaceae bacterium]
MEVFSKSASPLTEEEWKDLEEAIYETGRQVLVCRRFLRLIGPIGPGHQVVSFDVLSNFEIGACELTPNKQESEPIKSVKKKHVPLPTIHKSFAINWRDLEYVRQFSLPIDTSVARACAVATALAEDSLIIHGNKELGIEGFLNVEGHQTMSMSDWEVVGNAFSDIANGISRLVERGFYGPYYLILNPKEYVKLNRVYHNTGILEIEQVRKLVKEVYQTPIMPEKKAILINATPADVDLVVGIDMSLLYIESTNMNHHFRVLEMVLPRIKRPASILVIGK